MTSPKSVLRLLFLFALNLSLAATAYTQISFPSFSYEINQLIRDIFTFGDAAYDLAKVGARTLASKGSCGAMVYVKPVRTRNAATGSVAWFSTLSFFMFTTHGLLWESRDNPLEGSGFAFSFLQNVPMTTMHDGVSQVGAFGACKSFRSFTHALTHPVFYVRFDTDYSPIHRKEHSNNFIWVDTTNSYEYDVEAYTHNLCGNDTHCTYFTNGKTFTAWVDFTSSSQTLEVRMANGSSPKPLQPLLRISNYEYPKSLPGEVLVNPSPPKRTKSVHAVRLKTV